MVDTKPRGWRQRQPTSDANSRQPRAHFGVKTMNTIKPGIGPWTDNENNIIAASYMRNLGLETRGTKYNKAASRREGLAAMAHAREDGKQRSHGSWEMKCCNISAVLQAAGLPWINGYKPLGHGQAKPLARALLPWALAYGFNDSELARLERLA